MWISMLVWLFRKIVNINISISNTLLLSIKIILQTASDCDVIKYLVYVEKVCNEPSNAELFFNFPTKHRLVVNGGANNFILSKRNSFVKLYKKLDECGKVSIDTTYFFHIKIWLSYILWLIYFGVCFTAFLVQKMPNF